MAIVFAAHVRIFLRVPWWHVRMRVACVWIFPGVTRRRVDMRMAFVRILLCLAGRHVGRGRGVHDHFRGGMGRRGYDDHFGRRFRRRFNDDDSGRLVRRMNHYRRGLWRWRTHDPHRPMMNAACGQRDQTCHSDQVNCSIDSHNLATIWTKLARFGTTLP